MTERWEKLTDLFHAALDRTPPERSAFLDAACAGDEPLRAEIESLLRAHEQSGEFLERPAADVASALIDDDIELLAEGQRLGPYLIKEQIGRGGMGVVYLAEDTRLGREVAVKMLPPLFARDEMRRDRLRIEARAAATLSHPGIATLFALEEIDDTLFLVFEFVRGRTLREMAQEKALPPRAVIDLGVQIGRALAAAHSEGIVHRDLKPDNIIVCESGVAKVLDFGVARFERGTPAKGKRITESGALLGTPAYMSPEQVDGKDVDFRSDLFSFGVILYELLAGAHPFEAHTPLSTAARVLSADPPVLWEHSPAVPHELDRIIRKCMRKDPSERYQSTADLVVDLELLQRVTDAQRAPTLELKPAPRLKRALSGPRAWGQMHQIGVMLVSVAMMYPVWHARQTVGGTLAIIPFVLLVVGVVLNGTLRVHMLFTAAFNVTAFPAELKRAGPWIQRSDCLIGAVLIVSAISVAVSHTSLASVLAGFGIGLIIVSLMIEPATTRAAFPRRLSGGGRRTPLRR
jgi:predicted Ser/Thr protein kinase